MIGTSSIVGWSNNSSVARQPTDEDVECICIKTSLHSRPESIIGATARETGIYWNKKQRVTTCRVQRDRGRCHSRVVMYRTMPVKRCQGNITDVIMKVSNLRQMKTSSFFIKIMNCFDLDYFGISLILNCQLKSFLWWLAFVEDIKVAQCYFINQINYQ